MAESTVERVVLTDGYAHVTPTGEPGKYQTAMRTKGEKIQVTEAQAKAGEEVGSLGDETALQQVQAARAAAESGTVPMAVNEDGEPISDDELEAMSAGDLVAFLNNNPGELDRVEDLEDSREKPRKTVTAAIEATRAKLAEIESDDDVVE